MIVLKRQSVMFRAVPEPDLLWGALHPVGGVTGAISGAPMEIPSSL